MSFMDDPLYSSIPYTRPKMLWPSKTRPFCIFGLGIPNLFICDIFTFNVFVFWPYCFFDLNLLFRLNHIKHISWEPLYQELPETFSGMQSRFCVEVPELVRVIWPDRRLRSRLEPLIRWKRNRLQHSWKIRVQKLRQRFQHFKK